MLQIAFFVTTCTFVVYITDYLHKICKVLKQFLQQCLVRQNDFLHFESS